jgi:hypothetical protein
LHWRGRVVWLRRVLVVTEDSGGTTCDTFAPITTNGAGQITGVSVNGEPVAGRVATAPWLLLGRTDDDRCHRLPAHRPATGSRCLQAHRHQLRPGQHEPGALASLSGASNQSGQDALPDELAPGDAVYAAALFGVTSPTGLFCLEPNDGFGEHLP